MNRDWNIRVKMKCLNKSKKEKHHLSKNTTAVNLTRKWKVYLRITQKFSLRAMCWKSIILTIKIMNNQWKIKTNKVS